MTYEMVQRIENISVKIKKKFLARKTSFFLLACQI